MFSYSASNNNKNTLESESIKNEAAKLVKAWHKVGITDQEKRDIQARKKVLQSQLIGLEK